jgi:hypothetical protein
MASLLKSGTQTIQVKGLTPELSYVASVEVSLLPLNV